MSAGRLQLEPRSCWRCDALDFVALLAIGVQTVVYMHDSATAQDVSLDSF